MAELVVFGAGVMARLAHVYFMKDSKHRVAAFVVDHDYRQADSFLGLPLSDFEEVTTRYPPDRYQMFIALSYARMNKVRAAKYWKAKELGYQLVSYVSSRCTFLSDHPVGDNCFILEDNTIQPFVRIGNNVTLWSGSSVAHDAIIEDHCFIASHAIISGHVKVGAFCFVGANATVRNSVTLAPETLVGAGAVVVKDTQERGVYLPPRSELLDRRSDEIEI